MAQADWLVEVGVDTRNAESSLDKFSKTAKDLLSGIGDNVVITVDTKKMTADTAKAIDALKTSLKSIPAVNLRFNLSGASRSINSFADAIRNNKTTIEQFTLSLGYLNDRIDTTMGNMARLAPVIRESAEAVRTISTYMRNAGANVDLATRSVEVYNRALQSMNRTATETSSAYGRVTSSMRSTADTSGVATRAHKSQEDAIGRLGKILDNTVFKFVEYEVIMRAFNGVVHEFTSSINTASNVQFESTLQKLYAPTINLNNALSDSIAIARQYGSDISDVQQAIGLWTKVTQDETSAAYLAMEAEKLRRISGIETLDVFRDSVAVLKQMGLAAKDLPSVYDQIAEAALKIAEPLKNMGKGGAEGVKDMMDGLTRFGAVGKGIGLDTTGIIALTANQVQAGAEGGKESGSALSNMVGALDTGSKSKANFDKIIGPITGADDYEKSLNLMKQMEKEAPKLAQAMADGLIKTKPGQVETFKTLEASIKGTIVLMEDLHKNSSGKLDLITDAELKTFQGRMDQLKASVQAFGVSFGKQLLPGATGLAIELSQGLLPALEKNVSTITEFGHVLASLAIAAILGQGFNRLTTAVADYGAAQRISAVSSEQSALSLKLVQAAGFDTVEQMTQLQQSLRQTSAIEAELRNAIIARGEAMGLAGTALASYTDATLAAMKATGEFDTVVMDSKLAMAEAESTSTNFGSALGGIAAGALRSLGPLAAMATAVWAVTTAMSAMSAQGAAQQGLHMHMQDIKDSKKSWWQQYNPLAMAQDVPDAIKDTATWASGNDSHRNDILDYANSISRNKSDEGREAADVLGRLKKHKDDNSPDELDRDENALSGLYQNHMNRNAYTTEDQRLKDLINAQKNAPGYTTPQSTPGGATTEDATGGAKGPNAEQQALQNVQATKADASAATAAARDNAAAEKDLADAIKQKNEALGITKSSIKEYNDAVYLQLAYSKQEITAAANERDSLEKQLPLLEKLKQAHPSTATKEGKEAAQDYDDASNAIVKSTAKVKQLQAEYQLLQNTIANSKAEMALSFDLHTEGLDNWSKQIEEVKRKVSSSIGYSDTLSAVNSGRSSLEAGLKSAQSNLTDPKVANNVDAMAKGKAVVDAYRDALDELAKSEDNATTKAQGFSDQLKTLQDTVSGENTTDLAKALGIDTGSLDEITSTVDGLKKIQEEIKSAQDDFDKSQKTQADVAAYNSLLKEFQLREQMIPILANEAKVKEEIKKIEDSKEYKTIQSGLDKMGSNSIDKWTNRAFGKGDSFGKDLIGGELKDAWSTQATKMTQGLFGIPKDQKELENDQLKTMYVDHVNGLKEAAATIKAAIDALLANGPKAVDAVAASAGLAPLGPLNLNPTNLQGLNQGLGTTSTAPFSINSPIHAMDQEPYPAAASTSNKGPATNIVDALTNGNVNQAKDLLDAAQTTANNTTSLMNLGKSSGASTPDVGSTQPGSTSISNASFSGSVTPGTVATGVTPGGTPLSTSPAATAATGAAAAIQTSLGSIIPGMSRALGGVEGASSSLSSATGATNPITSLLNGGLPGLNKSISSLGTNVGWGTSHGLTSADLGLGLTVGGLSGSLFGGGSHDTNGEIGGALGSLFGPVGSVIGGVVGGLFGHSDDVAAMPDKYDSNFAQEEANMNGLSYTSEASGTQYMSGAVAAQTGGQGDISYIEEMLAKYPNPQSAPAWLQPYYSQAMSTFGESATGGGTIKYGTDIANEHIVGATGASTTDQNYSTINNLATAITTAAAQHTNTAQAPILSISAYGSNGAYGNSIYNTPGLTSSQYNALQENQFGGTNLQNYYGTPGVGTSTANGSANPVASIFGASNNNNNLNITTNLTVDGNVLASVVNAVNALTGSRVTTQ